jgi:HK97 family phage major capsid protein
VDPIAVFEAKRKALIARSNELLAKAADAGSADEYRAELDAIDAELPTVEKDLARARASAERTRNEPAAEMEGPVLALQPPTPMATTISDQFLGAADWQGYLKAHAGQFSDNVKVESPKVAIEGSLVSPFRPRGAQSSHTPQTGGTQYSGATLILPTQSGIFDEGPFRRPLTILDLITRGTTGSDSVDYVRTRGFTNNAAVVPEADDVLYTDDTGRKPWSTLSLERINTPVYTIAHGEAATTRMLADAGQMRTLIDSWLTYGLLAELDDLVLNGGGTTTFDGILHVANTQDQSYVTNMLTTIRKAKTKVFLNGKAQANGVLMHPNDWEALDLELTLAGYNSNRDAANESSPRVWGLTVVESEAIAEGTAVVADFRKAVLWDRQQTTVQATSGYMDFFMKNLVAILAEMRAAFGVIRPTAFVITDVSSS